MMKTKNNLIAPDSYWKYGISKLNNNSKYCGVNKISNNIIPDHLLGLNISKICHIHDYMYFAGKNKKEADSIFLKNMKSHIENETEYKFLKSLRNAKAYLYYLTVKLFGGLFFKSSALKPKGI